MNGKLDKLNRVCCNKLKIDKNKNDYYLHNIIKQTRLRSNSNSIDISKQYKCLPKKKTYSKVHLLCTETHKENRVGIKPQHTRTAKTDIRKYGNKCYDKSFLSDYKSPLGRNIHLF